MKITKVEAIPLRQHGEVKLIADATQDGLIIKIHTDEGIVGYGEVDSSPTVVKAIIDAPNSHKICCGLGNLLVGEDPFEIDKLWNKMYFYSTFYGRRGAVIHAISGLDIALWDIMGKALNMPIYQLLGGALKKTFPVYASTLMPYTPEEAYEETKKLCDAGYKAIKLGWGGFEKGPKISVELVRAAREAAGPDLDIMLDLGFVNSSNTPIDAASRILLAKELSQFKPYWIEEPLMPDDLDGYRQLSEAVDIRIACGEQETTIFGFRQLIEQAKVDILQPDVTRCGGLTEARRIAHLAQAHNKTVVPHAWSSGIVVAASTHFIAATNNSFILEYCIYESPISRDLVKGGVQVKDGYAEVLEKPGLGIEVNEEILAKYRCDK